MSVMLKNCEVEGRQLEGSSHSNRGSGCRARFDRWRTPRGYEKEGGTEETAGEPGTEAGDEVSAPEVAPFNPDERERLILEHLSLVRHLVARVAIGIPAFVSREDLVSAGVAGLIEAIDRFDPNRNCSLKTYCTLRVRGAILDELRRLNWAPRSVQRDSRALSEAHERLAQKLGREPSEAEIRDELGMTAEEFDAFLDRVKPSWFSSLQEPATSSDESSPLLLEEVVPDARAFTAGEQMLRAEDIAIVRQQLSRMPQREAQVLALYYLEDLRLKEIAEVLQVTESRVSQIHTLALAKLRSAFEKGRKK